MPIFRIHLDGNKKSLIRCC
ncbi:TPA: hypothetical protein ACXJGM_000263 [Escherichia coli]|nr:hypothetical protein [Escherichia coli]MCV8545901.1 hypothetical protein [Escherichia coli]MDD8930310.1 hypothetical protein [Escherichia coli]MDI0685979.1 hypothetical protein [Escherichia coli]UPZ22323.1 hypothetical protein MYF74_09370 [Escherichia coli]WFV70096.1 hypothetical protein NFJ44_01170 [Escherichia coli]